MLFRSIVPTPLILDVTLQLSVIPTVPYAVGEQYRAQAQSSIITYLNTMDLGASVYPDRLINQALNISSDIIDAVITGLRVNGVDVPVDVVTATTYQRLVAGSVTVN